jgi:murein DD-endopeptidase MepM/ murein hydrolase activator NlpD
LELTPTTQLTLSSVIFIENVGQFADDVRFQVRGSVGGGVWLSPDAIWITLLESATKQAGLPREPEEDSQSPSRRGVHLKLSFVGANPNLRLMPFAELDTHVSFFSGNDPADWQTKVPVWGGMRYQDLYPGIDLELTSEGGRYVQRLVVHPGADLGAVHLLVEGAESLALQPLPQGEGEPGSDEETPEPQPFMSSTDASEGRYYLRLVTALGEFSLPLFQVVTADGSPLPTPTPPAPHIAGGSNVVDWPFLLQPIEEAETEQKRSIAPTPAPSEEPAYLLYSTLLGRSGNDAGYAIAVDGTGSAHVTGQTYLPGLPITAGSFDASVSGDYDAFAVRLKPNGSEVAYAAFWGGTGNDAGDAIALDPAGNAYVTGATGSSDLPTTAGAFDTSYNEGTDGFVAKLTAAGTELAYATFLGGSGDDWSQDISVDGTGNAYVVGSTQSTDFPATTGAWDTVSDNQDAFVVKLNALGSGLVYATFLGGSDADEGNSIAVDGTGQAHVTGSTRSSNFSTTADAFDANYNGDSDAFVARLSETGTDLVYATFLGGSRADRGNGIATDSAGDTYVAGSTQSPEFPTTVTGFGTSHHGGDDAFVVKIDTGGTELAYASFLGGSGDDWAQAIAVDATGHAYVTGSTESSEVAELAEPLGISHNGGHDTFVVRVNELGTDLVHTALVGGGGQDHSSDIAVDTMGSVYVSGLSESPDFPVRARGSQPNDLGFAPLKPANVWDTFVFKLVVGVPFLDLPISYVDFAQSALGNMNDRGPGRVNSWFDHSYPNHTQNRKLVRWDGQVSEFSALSPPLIGESWYDGHGGTDFQWETRNEPIYAAAQGLVIDAFASCRPGDQACGAYFGNRVWIDHGNGYATVYAHLGEVYVSRDMAITDPITQPLGTMGNTGRSQGMHLHFGLYFDQNGDGQWSRAEAIDPYGWAGMSKDPWAGFSRYLWKHPLWTRQVIREVGATLVSPSQWVTATIPGAAFDSAVLVELWDVPSETLERGSYAVESPTEWRSTGHSFRLVATQLDTSAGASASRPRLDSVPDPTQPITLTVTYRADDLLRLDPSRLTIRRWDEARKAWDALPTTVDSSRNRVIAQTTELGQFDLHAPLLCPADSQEPDDHYAAAQAIPTNGLPIGRGFDIAEDKDWFRINVKAGSIYVIATSHLADGVGTAVSLHNLTTLATLAPSESRRSGGMSYLKWQAPQDDSVLLRVGRAGGSSYGCDATYALSVREVVPPDGVAIAGPTEGTVQASYAFTATISPTVATLPISYTWQVTDEVTRTSAVSTSNTFSVTWRTTGTHQVLVTATNEAGAVTGTVAVIIHPPASAAFVAAPRTGNRPLEVVFTNTSTGLYADSWWEFGDDKASRAEHPSHTYRRAGVFTVTLTISGLGGRDTLTRTAYITVEEKIIPRGTGDYVIHLPVVVRSR